jgi:LPS-assembly lipoprotein
MSWRDTAPRLSRLAVAAFVVVAGGLTAGCFQPLYGTRTAVGGGDMATALRGVEVLTIDAPNGTPAARMGVEVRNNLIFNLTGGAGNGPATHQLKIALVPSNRAVIVDPTTARPDVNNYGLDAVYSLTEIGTKKIVVTGRTFARVSYDIPGQQQRFAAARGLRDAEDRAAQVIADQIQARLQSFFTTGS